MTGDPTSSTLAQRAGALLNARNLTLATAESCTGGLLGDYLTNVSGISAVYLGGVIAYSYDAKEHLLEVHHNTLFEHGAVSRQTALEMAHGARRALRADLALSITGIAGPGGGLPGKPVGLVYVGFATRAEEWCERRVWEGDRVANKEQSAQLALRMLVQYLETGSTESAAAE